MMSLTVRVATPSRPNSLFKWETLLIGAILVIAALAHGVNMFHFPSYSEDEGTYMSQAWAVVHEGKLAPYIYVYDHAPAGWLQIALWTLASGGFHTFGMIINSGRVFMLLIQVCSTFVLYLIARNISQNTMIAAVVSFLFALSPYGLYYHRLVLLDNICTMWMLLSIFPLVTRRIPLKHVWFSAIALSLSILSKEVAVFVVPAMAYLVYYQVDHHHRWFAVIGWLTILFTLVSLYPLMALLKHELFPTSTLLVGNPPHVNFIGMVLYNASRGKDGGLFDIHSAFWQMTAMWVQDDPTLVIGGSLSAILATFAIRRYRLPGIMGIMTLSLWLFLGRGGLISSFYLIPALPLLTLNVGLLLWLVTKNGHTLVGVMGIITLSLCLFLGRDGEILGKYVHVRQRMINRCAQVLLIAFFLVGMLIGYTSPSLGFQEDHLALWNSSPTTGEEQAVMWIQHHIPANSYLLIDNFMWADLHDTGNTLKIYRFAYDYWKVENAPILQVDTLHNDWRKVDYVITTLSMQGDAYTNHLLAENVINHSTLVAKFDTGWSIEIRRVNK